MALLDQLRLLDRALRDVRVREALRTGDRGGRRLARFAGSVAPADLAVLRAVDARRFEAVAQRQAELIRDRWWAPRFPGILLGAAKALGGTTRDVALGTLASPVFDRREGADETGAALLGYVLGREDRTNDPEWLSELVAYEYLVALGLPRRAKGETARLDVSLEERILPEGTRFLEVPKKAKAHDLSLARKVVVLPLEFPVSQIREALLAGQDVAGDVDGEPHVLVFTFEKEGATEQSFGARAHDVLDLIAAAPLEGVRLLESFEVEDRYEVHGIVSALVDAGILTGTKPPAVEPPPPPRSKKGKATGAASGKKAASKPSKSAKAPAAPQAKAKPVPPAKPVAKAKPEPKTKPVAKAKPLPKAKPVAKAKPKPAAPAARPSGKKPAPKRR
jgi:hypothetical protein